MFSETDDILLDPSSYTNVSAPAPSPNTTGSSTTSQEDSIILEILSCASDDTILLEKFEQADSPATKKQKEEDEAKRVCITKT